MKVLDVIFYQFYLFYKNRLKQESPEFTATLAISAIIFFVLMGVVVVVSALLFDKIIKWVLYALVITIVFLFYKYFVKSGRWKIIVEGKPLIKNVRFSKFIAILFFGVGLLFLFGAPLVGRYIHLGSPW